MSFFIFRMIADGAATIGHNWPAVRLICATSNRCCRRTLASYHNEEPIMTNNTQGWWLQHREASLNWLALGLLLAAWNASDNDTSPATRPRPQALRGYSYVSVRAAAAQLQLSRHP
jgi:hypothetical protein